MGCSYVKIVVLIEPEPLGNTNKSGLHKIICLQLFFSSSFLFLHNIEYTNVTKTDNLNYHCYRDIWVNNMQELSTIRKGGGG